MKYIKITFQQLLDDGLQQIIPRHYEELSDKAFPLDPDYNKYLQMDSLGMLAVLGAYDNDELVGYAIHIIAPHLHYKTAVHSMEDLYYLKHEYRKGMQGLRFLKAQEQMLIDLGVHKIIFGTKMRANVGILFERMGYKHFEELYSKIIKH